eukprot:CAMPEP_0115255354 /NCGR_PEP_ID=MMETSP0270-20121206/45670_1 /TAXON_ID=71861 /ORGANISM="Scrippsiella trochoidea, Strain CCMP3099" /LENGTH=72 /DNA_ID=CAMNT_0002670939 /DNA_START=317 /DNA_END=535 /DNA_ORIENTATION=-
MESATGPQETGARARSAAKTSVIWGRFVAEAVVLSLYVKIPAFRSAFISVSNSPDDWRCEVDLAEPAGNPDA